MSLALDQLVDRVAATSRRLGQTLLSRLELGQRPLTPERIGVIAAALGALPDEIV